MSTIITTSVSVTPRGVTEVLVVTRDGGKILTKTSTRKWGDRAPKGADQLLIRSLFGQINVEVRRWMDQATLPF
jgi:hypothetical protein